MQNQSEKELECNLCMKKISASDIANSKKGYFACPNADTYCDFVSCYSCCKDPNKDKEPNPYSRC